MIRGVEVIYFANLVVGALWAGLWAWACRRLGRLGEWHHEWIGLALLAAPWHFWIGPWALVPWALGQWIAEDDAILHDSQALHWRKGDRKLTGADDMASFWHRLAAHMRVI